MYGNVICSFWGYIVGIFVDLIFMSVNAGRIPSSIISLSGTVL